jgi:decaprenylphospho-beta-D-ribofuranose 2-oxidase
VRAFNEAWYRKAPSRPRTSLESIPGFFHPLDLVRSWNRVYGPAGFLQYQFVVPFGQEAVLRRVIERLVDAGSPSFLTVLKRFGAANPAPLSFPAPGWTLALDVPASPALGPLFRQLDGWVLDAGGRHYLAKDAHATPEVFARGYPGLATWQAVRDEMDPKQQWCSDQARRLELLTRPARPRERRA